MKKHRYTILLTLGLSAFTLAACQKQTEAGAVTQPIVSSAAQTQARSGGVEVPVSEAPNPAAPLPAQGESIALAAESRPQTTPVPSSIEEAEAKKIALDHAGLKESDLDYLKIKQDFHNGAMEYEVEFYVGNKEYDYDIDASTGTIRSFDYEIEDLRVNRDNSPSSASSITLEEAKKIALSKVPGAADSDIRIKTDYDDGRLVYEGEIIYQGMEYEFDLDAKDGALLKWEAESLYD